MTHRRSPVAPSFLPPAPATVHFIGIGGISMSGLAHLLHDWGYRITGSDASASVTTRRLGEAFAEIVIGHSDTTLAGQADVVVSTRRAELQARDEIAAAVRNRAVILKRGQLVGLLAEQRHSYAVAGTHGKSTTSGMLTSALGYLDRSPSFAIGALLPGAQVTAAAGEGEDIVVEADEFDRSFLWLKPDIAIVSSVSFDHPDIYASQDDYDNAFLQFCQQVNPEGLLIIAADDVGCTRVRRRLGADSHFRVRVQTFGESSDADWQLRGEGDGIWSIRTPDLVVVRMTPAVGGRHNARNATSAIAALAAGGIAISDAIAGVEQFTGVGRRFEHKGSFYDVDVVDDYAHHPEEITAVIQASRDQYPGRRLIVVHQPHTYSRTQLMLARFAEALDGADVVVLLDIYPSGETDTLGVSSAELRSLISVPTTLVSGPREAAAAVATLVKRGDVVLTLGAGDITMAAASVVADLKKVASRKTNAALRRPAPVVAVEIPGFPGLKAMRDAPMSMFTTMRLGGKADFVVRAGTPEALIAAQAWARSEGYPGTVIGGGSNLLFSDQGIRDVVIVARSPGERAADLLDVDDLGDHVRVRIAAQAPLSWVGRHCSEQGWAGMDWGVGLPGQIGGATVNNAGAHGTEIKDRIVGMDLLQGDGTIEHVDGRWLDPSYRMTVIKAAPRPRPWIVLRTHLLLKKRDRDQLVELADEHAAFRKRTQPTGACSGSTFANPPGDFAGRLLEAAGLKGHRYGDMQLSPKHANWVVNTGGGTAEQAWHLIMHAQATVAERFGIRLHPEIERVGPFSEGT